MNIIKEYIKEIRNYLGRQHGGAFTKVLTGGTTFESTKYKIAGVQFTEYPASISIAEATDKSKNIIDCVALQKDDADSTIIIPEGIFIWTHELGYTKFLCDKTCVINLVRQ